MSEGWIKLHRKILDWEWFNDRNVFHLFIHILLNTNHEEKKWRGHTIKRGQYMTSLDNMSKKTKLSVAQIRTALTKLKSTNEIAIKTTSLNTLISVTNWELYQLNDTPNDKRIANESQTDDKRIATTKNYKNVKNEKNVVNDPFFEMFRRATGNHVTDEELVIEIAKFRNKYPNIHPNQAGALINAWISNIGKSDNTKPRIVV